MSKARLEAFSNRSFSAGFEAECGSQEDEHRQRHGVLQKHRIYQPSIATTPAQHPELARRCLLEEERQHKPNERRGADCDDRPNNQESNLGVEAARAIWQNSIRSLDLGTSSPEFERRPLTAAHVHVPCVEVDAEPKELKGFIHLHRQLDLVHIRDECTNLVEAPRDLDLCGGGARTMLARSQSDGPWLHTRRNSPSPGASERTPIPHAARAASACKPWPRVASSSIAKCQKIGRIQGPCRASL